MKIGILGGTFDPVHLGHTTIATDVFKYLSLDEMWFICAADPPYKRNVSPAYHRFSMLKMALSGFPEFFASDIEIRKGYHYSIDTMNHLLATYPEDDFHFIVGMDAWREITSWKAWRELVTMVRFVVVGRGGLEIPDVDLPNGTAVTMVPTRSVNISSTAVRAAYHEGYNAGTILNREVSRYIENNHLYRAV